MCFQNKEKIIFSIESNLGNDGQYEVEALHSSSNLICYQSKNIYTYIYIKKTSVVKFYFSLHIRKLL